MENWLLPIFLIISGLTMCGADLPRWVVIIGGVCGVIAGVFILPL
jgi:hypothetical protein